MPERGLWDIYVLPQGRKGNTPMKCFSGIDFILITIPCVMIIAIALVGMGVHSYASGNYFYSYTVSEQSVLAIILLAIGMLVLVANYTGVPDDYPLAMDRH